MLEQVKRVHMVGIGGIGMSGIAQLLHSLGYEVNGSDLVASRAVARLRAAGISVSEGHAAGYVGATDLVVVSSAVPDDNPEVVEASRRRIPVVGRGAMLAEIARLKRSIAVAGSHGKTTTSSMVALVLEAAGFDPTAVIGGIVSAFGSNTRQGRGPFIVVEADESDRSFLHLDPEIAVLTNVDDEHIDAYDGLQGLVRAFEEFATRVPSNGCVVVCADDVRLSSLASQCPRHILTYGIEATEASVRADDIELDPDGSRCRVTVTTGATAGEVALSLPVPGRHNLRNALAAVAVASWLDVDPGVAVDALGRFSGVHRRFQRYRTAGKVDVVDDYGHHPTEIAAVLDTARLSQPGRLVVLFQPHRYTRTARLLNRFGEVLARADAVVLTDIYAASEPPIAGTDAAAVAAAVRRHASISVEVADSLDAAAGLAVASVGCGDMVVVLGAGSVGRLVPRVIELLERRSAS